VRFQDPEDAKEAQQRFDGVELCGRAMVLELQEEEI
jgi:hypothetical protein